MSVDSARAVVERGIGARIYPAAAVEVGRASGAIWREAFGRLTFAAGARSTTEDTIFDLASLTKPIATASAAMVLAGRGALRLDELVTHLVSEWRSIEREPVTIRDLLEHASGLPARLVDPPPSTRREFEHEICTIRLEYEPRTRSIYSDLGFILLGFVLADVGGARLDVLFEGIVARRPELQFGVPAADRVRAAPTDPMDIDPRRGRKLVGEVHDNYAAALGGIAGHAGLFGTAAGVGAFARMMLRGDRPFSPDLIAAFTARTTVPGSSRALGWDTMLPTSSCGEHMSRAAYGHVGFTGTSLWIDPARDRYFVLLTNRVCGGGTEADIRSIRRAFHDSLHDL